jgi:hypothetical protein
LSAPKHPCSNRIQRIRTALYSGQATSQVSGKVCCQPSMAAKVHPWEPRDLDRYIFKGCWQWVSGWHR